MKHLSHEQALWMILLIDVHGLLASIPIGLECGWHFAIAWSAFWLHLRGPK